MATIVPYFGMEWGKNPPSVEKSKDRDWKGMKAFQSCSKN